jgi:hypothetical protein
VEAKLNGAVGTITLVSIVVVPFRFIVLPEGFQPMESVLELVHVAVAVVESNEFSEAYAVLTLLFPSRLMPFAESKNDLPTGAMALEFTVICALDDAITAANPPMGTFTSAGRVTAAVVVGI